MCWWGLTNTLDRIAHEVPDKIAHIATVLKELAYNIILLVAAVLFGVIVGLQQLYAMYKAVVPLTAEEYD